MQKTKRSIIRGQIFFLGFLFICVLLSPHYLLEANEGGVSNYGVHVVTIIPYSLAFGFASVWTYHAAISVNRTINVYKTLHLLLLWLSALYTLTLASTYPYKINREFDFIHQLIGGLLICFSLAFSTWLLRKFGNSIFELLGFALQLAGFGLAILNYFDVVHILFIAEAFSAVGFAMVLINAIPSASAAHTIS